jgi:hypothetical protein
MLISSVSFLPCHLLQYRRITKGFSRSQARGHPNANEKYLARRPLTPVESQKLQHAVKDLRQGHSLTKTADDLKISRERLRRILRSAKLIRKKNGNWIIRDDAPLRMPLFSKGEAVNIIPADRKTRSEIGKYLNAVRAFLRSNKPAKLAKFKGKSAIDVTGEAHPYETDPNTLYRLNRAGSEAFDEFYSIGIFARG